jgi:phage terminase large subunit
VNFITEIGSYTWDKDKFGNKINKPIDDFNHLMDAMRYAVEKDHTEGGWSFN